MKYQVKISLKYLCFVLFLFISFKSYSQLLVNSSKSDYTIFHPTPKNLMRDFETDRPDVTESAYTVDAGHFQVETDLFKTEHYNIDNIRTVNNYFNTANIKLGITNSLDFQLVVSTLNSSRTGASNTIIKKSDFGGLTFRLKQNLWGNDNGKTALAMLPYVNFPSASSERFSGGIVIPFAMSLSNGWDLGAQLESELENNQTGNNYHFNFLASATTSYSICKNLDFFVEGVITKDNESKLYEYFINGGPTYSISENLHIDCGVYYGIKNISSKTYFLGLSFRI